MRTLLAATLALACLAGCGGEEQAPPAAPPDAENGSPPPPDTSEAGGEGLLRVVHAQECCYIEGQRIEFRVDGPDGTVVDDERDPDALSVELLSRTLPAGRYRVQSAERPCDGNCGNLDPPTDRCDVTVEVPAGGEAHVLLRIVPGGGCSTETAGTPFASDEPPVSGAAAFPAQLVRIDAGTGAPRGEEPFDQERQLVGAIDSRALTLLPGGQGNPTLSLPGDPSAIGVVVTPELVVTTISDGTVVAYGHDGAERWRHASDGSRPVVGERLVVLGLPSDTGTTEVAALDLATGEERWRAPGAPYGAAVVGDEVLVGSTGQEAFDTWWVLDARTGERRRTFTLPEKHELGFEPLVVDGRLVSTAPDADGQAQLMAIDPDTGDVAWRQALDGAWPTAAPVLAGDRIVLATSQGLIGFDAARGEERWRVPSGSAPGERLQTPVAAGDDVLVLRR